VRCFPLSPAKHNASADAFFACTTLAYYRLALADKWSGAPRQNGAKKIIRHQSAAEIRRIKIW
jgi:hypothetical protein